MFSIFLLLSYVQPNTLLKTLFSIAQHTPIIIIVHTMIILKTTCSIKTNKPLYLMNQVVMPVVCLLIQL